MARIPLAADFCWACTRYHGEVSKSFDWEDASNHFQVCAVCHMSRFCSKRCHEYAWKATSYKYLCKLNGALLSESLREQLRHKRAQWGPQCSRHVSMLGAIHSCWADTPNPNHWHVWYPEPCWTVAHPYNRQAESVPDSSASNDWTDWGWYDDVTSAPVKQQKNKAKAKGKVQAKAKAKAQPTLHVRGNATSSNVCVILTSEGGLWGVGHPNTTQPFI